MAHALILGASGISGWSIMNQARVYPTLNTFARITGTTNRPLTLAEAQLPADPRYLLVSGIDFTKPVEEVKALLKEKVPGVETVSHVFFTAYIEKEDFEATKVANTNLLEVAISAIEVVAPGLKTVVLQTGGKGYGMQFSEHVKITPPLREDQPRIPEPWASKIFYYSQYDLLVRMSRGKSWTFTEIRPDGIVGFTPTTNPMNLAEGIGLYLTLFRLVYGAGASVPFPGSERSYHCTHGDTSQDILAHMEIFASLNPDQCCDGKAFNITDGRVITWAEVWPKICKHHQLVGAGPSKDSVPMEDFVKKHSDEWQELADEHGLPKNMVNRHNWGFTTFMLVDYDFDRHFDLSRARSVGFVEETDTADEYIKAWKRMRAAKRLPPLP